MRACLSVRSVCRFHDPADSLAGDTLSDRGVLSAVCCGVAGRLLPVIALLCGSTGLAADRPFATRTASVVLQPMWPSFPVGTPGVVLSTDTRIGDARVSYKDPEFRVEGELMVWQDQREEVWLCRFDPRTGDLIPRDGRGRLIGQGAPYVPQGASIPRMVATSIYNGPEFGLSQRGLGIYFCQGDDPRTYQLARVGVEDQSFEILVPGQTSGLRGAFVTDNPQDESSRILYGRLVRNPDGGVQVITEWFDEYDQDNIQTYPRAAFGSSGPHWIPGQRAIVTNVNDDDGVPQIVRYDIDTREITYLTSGAGAKVDAIFFEAPEYPGEQIFLCLVDRMWIEVYRRQGADWSCIRRIAAPDAGAFDTPPGTSSAEPVFHRGQTYFTYAVKYADDSSRIALASLDGQVNALVSQAGSLRQLDPEGVSVGDQLFVYYWTLANQQQIHELHRCQVQVWR
jgi:hypothetical protein